MGDYPKFGSVPRYNREIVVTEKIDGTNGLISITEGVDPGNGVVVNAAYGPLTYPFTVRAGSRNRWLTPDDDNYGFCKWVIANADTLIHDLGVGHHYGEWWGQGIQRRYDLDHKRFSLFNEKRWRGADFHTANLHVVPYLGSFLPSAYNVASALDHLAQEGSVAAPGFMDPEGVVLWHTAARALFKATIKNDSTPKSLQKAPSHQTVLL